MPGALFLLIVLIVAGFSLVGGFRSGFTSQTASFLGLIFGAVCARVFSAEFSDSFQWASLFTVSEDIGPYAANLVCSVIVYCVVFAFFSLFSWILRNALSVIPKGMFNRLLGAFFALAKNLLWVSIFFNLILCFNNQNALLEYERAADGNLVSSVMALAPALLGCYGAEDFSHFYQLEDAKSISHNFRSREVSGHVPQYLSMMSSSHQVKETRQ